jgi:hypothetical protein
MSIFEPPGPPEPSEDEPSVPPTPSGPLPPPLPSGAAAETGEFAEFFHTEDLPDKPVRVSHRGAIEASPLMQKLLAPVTAVAVVVVVILLLIWINGGSSGSKQSPAAVGPGPARSAPVAPSSSHRSRPVDTPTATRSTPSAPKTHGIPVKPQATKHAKPGVPTAVAPVTVLNNSRRVGLAAAVAAELRGRGWHVTAVGNQTHVIPVTTLYFAPGEHGAAVHLAHDFASIQRVAPESSGGIRGSGLTLVVTQSWVL